MTTRPLTHKEHRRGRLTALLVMLLISVSVLGACENTYKGIGRDIGNEEMKDGWD